MHYYTYPVQLNQKEMKRGLIKSVFEIPQILGIMTLLKNCRRFRDKYFASHPQEGSLSGNVPSLQHMRSCTEAVAVLLGGKKAFENSHSCRRIPFHRFSGPNSSLDVLQLRKEDSRGFGPSLQKQESFIMTPLPGS